MFAKRASVSHREREREREGECVRESTSVVCVCRVVVVVFVVVVVVVVVCYRSRCCCPAAAQSRIGEHEKVLKFPSVLCGCCHSGSKREPYTTRVEDDRKEDVFREIVVSGSKREIVS